MLDVTINYWLYLAMAMAFAGVLTVGMFKLVDFIESDRPLPWQSIRRNIKRKERR